MVRDSLHVAHGAFNDKAHQATPWWALQVR
jgi:hypothetical protein